MAAAQLDRPIARLLERLEGVRESSPGRWYARCPAHADRRPSLAVTETDDGRVLLFCLAGCTVGEIVAAVDLQLHDLFPRTSDGGGPIPRRQRWDYRALFLMLQHEMHVAAVAAHDLQQGRPLDEADRQRLHQAEERISRAAEVAT